LTVQRNITPSPFLFSFPPPGPGLVSPTLVRFILASCLCEGLLKINDSLFPQNPCHQSFLLFTLCFPWVLVDRLQTPLQHPGFFPLLFRINGLRTSVEPPHHSCLVVFASGFPFSPFLMTVFASHRDPPTLNTATSASNSMQAPSKVEPFPPPFCYTTSFFHGLCPPP